MGKSFRKFAQKLVPDLFIIFVNNPKQQLHARNSFENKILKGEYQKPLKQSTLFFSSKPSPL